MNNDLKKCIFIAVIVWLIPFCLRFVLGTGTVNYQTNNNTKKTITLENKKNILNQVVISSNLNKTFLSILGNNLKVGLINLAGGATFAIPTIFNLLINGYLLADTICIALNNNISLGFIMKSLLAPHLIELVGIWLTAAAGLLGAKICIKYIFYEVLPTAAKFYPILYTSAIGLVIIGIAAWLETYITIQNYLH